MIVETQILGANSINRHEEGNRRYYTVQGGELVSGIKLPNVTSILGIVNRPGLINWAVKLTKQGEDHNVERDKAAELGTQVHKAIQYHLSEGKVNANDYELEVLAMLGRWVEWYEDSGISIIATEKMIYHPYHKYAGTVDALGMDSNGKLVVLDWKSGGIWPEMAVQVSAYARAVECLVENFITVKDEKCPAMRAIIVGLGQSPAEVKEVDSIDYCFHIFINAKGIYSNLKDTKQVSVWKR